jgi:hypothetical protein
MKSTPEISSSPTPAVSAVCHDPTPRLRSAAFSTVTLPVKTTMPSPMNLPMAKPGRMFRGLTQSLLQ